MATFTAGSTRSRLDAMHGRPDGGGPDDASASIVPGDAAALSVGADEVAARHSRRSRSAAALPSSSCATARAASSGWSRWSRSRRRRPHRLRPGRARAMSPACSRPASSTAARIALALGLTEEIPYLKQQERLTFARCGIIDPLSLEDYAGPWRLRGLHAALAMAPAAIVEEVDRLRACAAAAAPASRPASSGRPCSDAQADQKYIVCNADEGDSGTFADRMIMEGDPFALIEGMTIAGLAVGATKGYVYIRSEYPHAFRADAARHRDRARARLARRRTSLGSGKRFDLEAAARRRRLYLRRRNLAAGKPRRQARQSSASSRRCRRSRACSASRPSSTT